MTDEPHKESASGFQVMIAMAGTDADALGSFLAGIEVGHGLAVLLVPVDEDGVRACTQLLHDPAIALPGMPLAEDGRVKTDRLAMVPRDLVLAVEESRVRLFPVQADEPDVQSGADIIFTVMARRGGGRMIGVVFSGAIQYVFQGAAAVKEAGGLLIVQDERTEAGRPDVASAADYLVPTDQIGRHLLDYVTYRMTTQEPQAISTEQLERIVDLVSERTGVDFSEYKKNTLHRRIARRMNINQMSEPSVYIDFLERSTTEAGVLYREMLIGVTRFFRDEDAFLSLAAAVIRPWFVDPQRQQPVRIWVAGCATGEEAYSIAILIQEAMAISGVTVPVKIFATDLDKESVDFASIGLYPYAIASEVSGERLERFFVRKADGFQVTKALREMVLFAHHNIVRDPPFFRMDLVTCRNLLIYLQPMLQRRLFNAFHFALGADGHLLLGTSETLGDMAQFFLTVDSKWKLYRKRQERLPRISDNVVPDRLAYRPRTAAVSRQEASAPTDDGLQEAIQQTLFHEFMPAFLVVDEHFEIHYISGGVDRYLALPRGKPAFNLIKMATGELSVALGTGIRRALRDAQEVHYDDITVGDGAITIGLVIKPFIKHGDVGKLAVVIFAEVSRRPQREVGQQFDLSAQTDQRIKDLEVELEHTKESLQAAIEELEASNEELQATNEEVLAANEELQSTNEELQSVNEELYTVNNEHQAKIEELTQLNNDILNLLGSTNIGTVFLDQYLCVRKFTQAATAQINLIDKDIGRPLAHLSNNIDYPDLVSDAEQVLKTLVPKQRRVCTREGQWHFMRILPYRTEDHVIKGVIITFIDISEIKVANELVRKLSNAMEATASMAMITNASGQIEYINQRFVEATGWPAEEVLGRDMGFLRRTGTADHAGEMHQELDAGRHWTGRLANQTRDGEPFDEDAIIIPLQNAGSSPASLLKISTHRPAR